MIKCVYCEQFTPDPHPNDLANAITVKCRHCNHRTPTGREDEIRSRWEELISRPFPRVTAAHALGLANAIYKTAEENRDTIKIARDDRRRKKLRKLGYASIEEFALIRGRTHRGITDASVVGAVVVMANGHGATPEHTIYVVFRGSNKASETELDDGRIANVDWRANLDNRMRPIGMFEGAPVMVHTGFDIILNSYRDRVLTLMNNARAVYPGANVVITGHSQGAAHAILFSYWVAQIEPAAYPFCIAFSPPRVGNFAFARHYSLIVADKTRTLAHDGPYYGSYLMVKGKDPVTTGVKHSYYASVEQTAQKADSGLLKAGIYAERREKNYAVAEEVYFHPPRMVQISGIPLGKGQIIHHHPGLFMKKMMKGL